MVGETNGLRRRHSAHPAGDAARMTDTLKTRKPHAGMRERGGEADLTPHDTNHPHEASAKVSVARVSGSHRSEV